MPILQDVLTEAQVKAQNNTNRMVETLLFFVSFMSLIGVLLNSHDYALKNNKDKISTLQVLSAMLPLSLNDILSFAVALALIGLIVFAILRFEILNKLSK